MMRCLVCHRPLKTPKAQEAGVGARCKKKIDPEALKQLQEIMRAGFDGRIQDGRVIQMQIRVDDPPDT